MSTTAISADSRDQLRSSQLAPRLNNRPLAVYPMRLNSIQPRAFHGQLTNDYSHTTFLLCFSVVCSHPTTHCLRDVPRSIIPYQQQRFLSLFDQSSADPVDKLCRNARYWPAAHKPQPYLFGIGSQHPVTANRFRVGIALIDSLLYESQRSFISPTVQRRLSKTTPPYFIYITQYPVRVLLGQSDQSLTRLFLRAYCGSGLVIQSRARFQLTFILRNALRIVSSETNCFVSPRSFETSATICNVQVERALPKWRGDWCSKSRNFSHFASSSSGLAVLGRDDFCSRQVRASEAKARITLRTVWSLQLNCRAIWRGVLPSALKRRIWVLLSVNACGERKPVRKATRSFSVKDRTKIGSFIQPIFSQAIAIQTPRLVIH